MAAVPQFLSNDVVKLSGNIFLTISGLDPLIRLSVLLLIIMNSKTGYDIIILIFV